MNTSSRRHFLRLAALASVGGLLAACQQPAAPSPTAAPAKPTAAPAPPTSAPAATAKPAAAPTQAPAAKTEAKPTAAPAAAKPGQAVPKDHPVIAKLYEDARKEGRVEWWDQHDAPQVETIKAAFLKSFPGIEINFSSATQDVAKPRAIQEARAGAISFDFIDTGQNYDDFKAAGITADNTDLLLMAGLTREDIYEGTYSPEYTVYGAAFNSDLVKREELPTTWEGFLAPKWKGKLGVETRLRPFVYGTPFFGGEDKVVDYLKKLKDQGPQFTTGDTRSQTLMVAGEFPVLVGAYLHRLPLHVGQPWGYIHLKEVYSNSRGPGYVVPPRAPHPNAGKLFLWWWCSPEGLKVIDEVRYKGNPAPGTGTNPSKYLEQNGMTVKFAPLEIEREYSRLERKYVEALGLPIT